MWSLSEQEIQEIKGNRRPFSEKITREIDRMAYVIISAKKPRPKHLCPRFLTGRDCTNVEFPCDICPQYYNMKVLKIVLIRSTEGMSRVGMLSGSGSEDLQHDNVSVSSNISERSCHTMQYQDSELFMNDEVSDFASPVSHDGNTDNNGIDVIVDTTISCEDFETVPLQETTPTIMGNPSAIVTVAHWNGKLFLIFLHQQFFSSIKFYNFRATYSLILFSLQCLLKNNLKYLTTLQKKLNGIQYELKEVRSALQAISAANMVISPEVETTAGLASYFPIDSPESINDIEDPSTFKQVVTLTLCFLVVL
ncbi:hypothetical protein FQR65_LT18712 [Abscondita terminalis]|nr:hypothetical protein FQR65_LT18712 [Abscondita terminalis]